MSANLMSLARSGGKFLKLFGDRKMMKTMPTARDYVQDGLIAMWDGIENAGWGTHSTSQLKELVSGIGITVPSGYTIASNHVEVRATNAMNITPMALSFTTAITVEYLVAFIDENTSRECASETNTANNGFRFKKATKLATIYRGAGYAYVLPAVGTVKCYTSTWDDNRNPREIEYADAVEKRRIQHSHTMAGHFGSSYRIGRANYTSYQDVYAIRIYSRALTAEEISHNYAIDKARFNLTTPTI